MTAKGKFRAALVLAAGMAGLVLGQTNLARAGTQWYWPVGISGTTPNVTAEGSMTDGRTGGDPLDYIGCSYSTENGWVECYARQGLGAGVSKRVYCMQDQPSLGMVTAVSGLNAASVLRWKLAPGGLCRSVQIWNESDYL
jgi:hypothetical protein